MKSFRAALVGAALVLTLAACGSEQPGSAALPVVNSDSATAVITPAPETSSSSEDPVRPQPSSDEMTSEDPTSEDPTSDALPAGEIDPAELVATVAIGYADVTSMSGEIVTNVAGTSGISTFSQTLVDGKAEAMEMNMDMLGIEMQIIYVDGKIYISGVLADQYADGKKYVEVSEDSENPQLKELYNTFATSIDQASANQYTNLLSIVSHVTDDGPDDIDGVQLHKFTATVDLTDLDSSGLDDTTKESMETLLGMGVEEFPMGMWLDADGRLTQVVQTYEVMGSAAETTVRMYDFNGPIEINAPDPSEVGHG